MDRRIWLGVDGGGTHTRAMAVDGSGQVLGYAQTGGANPYKEKNAKQHVRQAITDVLGQAGRTVEEIVALAAGFAGLDEGADQAWADAFIDLPGMNGIRLAVSDAQVAQTGALGGEPGMIVISGTGSVIFGVNEAGEPIRNYDFHQYAYSTARHLSYELVYRTIAGEYGAEDEGLVSQVLDYWETSDLAALGKRAATGFIPDRQERNRVFGGMAPIITDAAERGSPLASAVCDTAAGQLATGIRLVGSQFASNIVVVSLIGSVARSRYMQKCLCGILATRTMQGKTYLVRDPELSPVAGAVLTAFGQSGIAPTEERKQAMLSSSPYTSGTEQG